MTPMHTVWEFLSLGIPRSLDLEAKKWCGFSFKETKDSERMDSVMYQAIGSRLDLKKKKNQRILKRWKTREKQELKTMEVSVRTGVARAKAGKTSRTRFSSLVKK